MLAGSGRPHQAGAWGPRSHQTTSGRSSSNGPLQITCLVIGEAAADGNVLVATSVISFNKAIASYSAFEDSST